LIGTGAEFSGLAVFHKGDSGRMHKPMIAAVVFFSLIIFLIAAIGIFIIKSPPHNFCVLAYGVFVFFFGFIPMVANGGALIAVAKIDGKKM
jgi:hypothetical protein